MKSDSFYLAELEDKILEVVYNQTKDIPRPWGLVLSGGFDSSLLAALTKPDYTFSISFPYGPKYDEGRYRDAVIKHLGLNAKIITFTKEDFMENLEEGVKIMGEPVSHFSLAPFNLLMKKIGEVKGCNILSGEGPDEYLGGYARQIIIDEMKKLYEITELRNYKGFINRFLMHNNNQEEYGQLIWKYGAYMAYHPDDIVDYIAQFREGKYPLQGAIGKMDMECGVIEKMEQKLANAYDVKLHYPYINEAFAEYCYRLPDHLKIRNGVTKWAFREIAKKYLPEIMWTRSKMGGPVAPVGQWINPADTGEFDKAEYIKLQKKILHE